MSNYNDFKFEPKYNQFFVGREREIAWLDEHLFRHHYSQTPTFVTGPAGVGKTALLMQWFSTTMVSYEPLWVDALKEIDKNIEDDLSLLIKAAAETGLSRTGLTIVIDHVDHWTEKQLEEASARLYNYKIVSTIVFIRREKVRLRRSENLAIGPLSETSASTLLRRLLGIQLSDQQINQAVSDTKGYPLALSILSKLLAGENPELILSIIKEPLYDLSKSIIIPNKDILKTVNPIIIAANDNLINKLKKQPGDLRKISPREFEVLLADLLDDMGWEVELTKATRDGGSDILAYLNTDVGRLLCLVEAKHYREDRKVGVDLVRSLYGTLCDAQANSAMLVTTSSFSADAKEFQKKHNYQLSLREYADVIDWILKFGTNKGKIIK